MLKKSIPIFLCYVLLTASVFADTGETKTVTTTRQDDPTASKIYTLSLTEAINLALQDNPELSVCDFKVKGYEVSLNAARENESSSRDADVRVSTGLTTAYIKKGYYTKLYESSIRLGKIEKTKIESKIAYTVTEKYYNYKKSEKFVDIAERACKLADENKNAVAKRLQLGMVSALEVRNADTVASQSMFTKESYLRNLEIAKEDLKIALQLDGIDCSFILTDDIAYSEYEFDVEKDIEEAMKNRYDVNSLKESAELSKLYREITRKYTEENTAAYYTSDGDYMQNEYNYENNKKKIVLSIKNSYNAILSAKDNISVAEQYLSIKNQEYEAAQLKFEMGMMTNTELTTILNEISEYEVELENAKLSYKLAVEKYQYEIAIGL